MTPLSNVGLKLRRIVLNVTVSQTLSPVSLFGLCALKIGLEVIFEVALLALCTELVVLWTSAVTEPVRTLTGRAGRRLWQLGAHCECDSSE